MSYTPKILIVDDEPRMCDSIKILLSDHPYEIHTANNGKQAIEYITKNNPDLILLDIVMPGMNGYQVLDHLNHQSPDTQVVIITGHASPESVVKALRGGATDYIKKPLESEELLTTVRNALKRQRLKKDKRQAERARRESEEKFRTFIETATDFMHIIDKDVNLTYVNESMSNGLGYSQKEMIGMNITQILNKETREKDFKLKFEELITNGEITGEVTLLTKEGKEIPGETKIVAVYDRDGKYVGARGVFRDLTERKQVEEKIETSLKEKEGLLREIHHRVKSNMQVITSLLRLQAANIQEKQFADIFKASMNRVKSMSLIHEKLYHSEDFASVDFKGYVKSLVNNLFKSHRVDTNKVALKIEVEDISFGLDNAIPCGLIINELVSNSLKYAFPPERKGEIRIAFRSVYEDKLELTVSDDGIGLPEDLDFRNTQSLGLDLVMMLTEDQLEGKIELNRTEGTTYHIQFKMREDKPSL